MPENWNIYTKYLQLFFEFSKSSEDFPGISILDSITFYIQQINLFRDRKSYCYM